MPTSTPTSHSGMSFVTPSWLLRSSRCSLLKSSCSGPDYPSKDYHLAMYIHITNLHTVRVLHSMYSSCTERQQLCSFLQCYGRLLLFLLSCRSKGAGDYYRSMLSSPHATLDQG